MQLHMSGKPMKIPGLLESIFICKR